MERCRTWIPNPGATGSSPVGGTKTQRGSGTHSRWAKFNSGESPEYLKRVGLSTPPSVLSPPLQSYPRSVPLDELDHPSSRNHRFSVHPQDLLRFPLPEELQPQDHLLPEHLHGSSLHCPSETQLRRSSSFSYASMTPPRTRHRYRGILWVPHRSRSGALFGQVR